MTKPRSKGKGRPPATEKQLAALAKGRSRPRTEAQLTALAEGRTVSRITHGAYSLESRSMSLVIPITSQKKNTTG